MFRHLIYKLIYILKICILNLQGYKYLLSIIEFKLLFILPNNSPHSAPFFSFIIFNIKLFIILNVLS
jgi:hypothetical protein